MFEEFDEASVLRDIHVEMSSSVLNGYCGGSLILLDFENSDILSKIYMMMQEVLQTVCLRLY